MNELGTAPTTIPPAELREQLQLAVDVAWRAGRSTLAHYQSGVVADAKADGSPVTVADREAERIARELIAERFPDDGILGEEHGETGRGAARRWVLDPIDGTRTFVRGVPFFGFLLGLVVDEDPVLGVAYFPALGEMVAAARGCGCWWNGNPARVSGVARLDEALVLTTDVENAERLGRGAGWDRLRRAAKLTRTWGDCYGYALVATGRAEAMLDPVLNPWDILPFVPILEEAGGVVTSWPADADAPVAASSVGGTAGASSPAPSRLRRRHQRRARRRHSRAPPRRAAMTLLAAAGLDGVDFAKGGGLVPVVAQHAHTGEVLMLAWADRDALASTLRDGVLWLRSRSRNAPWRKGETSGNTLQVLSLHLDCDGDSVLARVVPAGPACHTGAASCFAAPPTLAALAETIADRAAAGASSGQGGAAAAGAAGEADATAGAADAAAAAAALGSGPPAPVRPSYTRRLLDDPNLRLKKLGEEAVELAVACAARDAPRVAGEAADLLFHLLVAAAAAGVSLADVLARLEARRGDAAAAP